MSDQLKIKNYQALGEVLFDIGPGLTAIIGESDEGKSSVFRSVETLATNLPIDRRHGTKETTIEWRGVCRKQNNKENQYEVGDLVLRAMRSGVPDEASKKLGLGPINFRAQHDPYYLLNLSPGAVARSFNELTDLALIDHVTAALKKKAAAAKEAADNVAADIKTATAKRVALDWAVQADRDLAQVEELEAKAEEFEASVIRLEDLLRQIDDADKWLRETPEVDLGNLKSYRFVLEQPDTLGPLLAEFDRLTPRLEELQHVPYLKSHALLNKEHIEAAVSAVLELEPLAAELKDCNDTLMDCPPIEEDLAVLRGLVIPADPAFLESAVHELERLPIPPDPSADIFALKQLRATINVTADTLAALEKSCWSYIEDGRRLRDLNGDISTVEHKRDFLLKGLEYCPLCRRVNEGGCYEDHSPI